MPDQVRPFRIAVPDEVISDLHRRLSATRWPDVEVVNDWTQGVPLAWIQAMCRHWQHDYDWRAREAALNRFEQFVTTIDAVDIHFIHRRSPHADARPLLISHGWPGSIVEFHKVIDALADPVAYGGDAVDAFHVICPSLPGFGFSGKPRETGWNVDRIAKAWAELMERLGYGSYFAQGGDWGAAITRILGVVDVEHCAAIHLTIAMGSPTRIETEGKPTLQEMQALAGLSHYREWGSGYATQQATRPQTLGYGLADSPSGQAAWILEKFWAWTDCDGHPENIFSRDELLDNVMLYWVTNSATSSARIYWESLGKQRPAPIRVPVGVAAYPKEIVVPVRFWMEPEFPDIRHFAIMPKGGHFAAFEQPQLFMDDVRAFFRTLR